MEENGNDQDYLNQAPVHVEGVQKEGPDEQLVQTPTPSTKSGNLTVVIVVLLVVLAAGAGMYVFGVLNKSNTEAPITTTTNDEKTVATATSSSDSSDATTTRLAQPNIASDPSGTPPLGDKIGYIKNVSVENGKTYIDFNEVQFFFGNEAMSAMMEDHVCPSSVAPEDCRPLDGYYIRYIMGTTTVHLMVSDTAKITVFDCGLAHINITPTELYEHYGIAHQFPCPQKRTFSIDDSTPYWITQDDKDSIASIEVQFVP